MNMPNRASRNQAMRWSRCALVSGTGAGSACTECVNSAHRVAMPASKGERRRWNMRDNFLGLITKSCLARTWREAKINSGNKRARPMQRARKSEPNRNPAQVKSAIRLLGDLNFRRRELVFAFALFVVAGDGHLFRLGADVLMKRFGYVVVFEVVVDFLAVFLGHHDRLAFVSFFEGALGAFGFTSYRFFLGEGGGSSEQNHARDSRDQNRCFSHILYIFG